MRRCPSCGCEWVGGGRCCPACTPGDAPAAALAPSLPPVVLPSLYRRRLERGDSQNLALLHCCGAFNLLAGPLLLLYMGLYLLVEAPFGWPEAIPSALCVACGLVTTYSGALLIGLGDRDRRRPAVRLSLLLWIGVIATAFADPLDAGSPLPAAAEALLPFQIALAALQLAALCLVPRKVAAPRKPVVVRLPHEHPTELEAAPPPEGRGTEPEAAAPDLNRAASAPGRRRGRLPPARPSGA